MTISNDLGLGPIDDIGPQILNPQQRALWALVDTGATSCALDQDFCQQMRLDAQGQKPCLFPGSSHDHILTYYAATLFFHPDHRSDQADEWCDVVQFAGVELSGRQFQAIIGMDILSQGKLIIDNHGHMIRFIY